MSSGTGCRKWSGSGGSAATANFVPVRSSVVAANGKGGGKGVFSKGVIYTLIVTNIISLIIGAGFG